MSDEPREAMISETLRELARALILLSDGQLEILEKLDALLQIAPPNKEEEDE